MNTQSPQWQELVTLIARCATEDGLTRSAIDFLWFGRRSSPSEPMHISQWASFALVVQGEKQLHLGDETFTYGPGDLLLTTLDMPVRSCVTRASVAEPNLGMGIMINPLRLQKFIDTMPLCQQSSVPAIARGITVNRVSESLLDAVVRLIKLLSQPQDIAMMAPLIEQEIFYRLMTGPEGPRLLNIAMAERPGNKVAQAASWLRENFHHQLKIEQLASSVGMSISSLHHHFKAVTAMTPMQYQKQLRLNEARRLMLLEKMDAGTAGYRVGYQSASQFSREYSRFYGTSPARDIKMMGQE